MFKCTFPRLKLGSLLITVLLCCGAVGAADLNCTYDSQGRLVRANYGSQMSIVYSYDAGGNPLSIQILNSGVTPAIMRYLVPSGAVAGSPGLAVPGVPASAGLTGPVYIFGLRQDARDRSNLAVQNMGGPDDGDITLRMTVFSGDPLAPFSQVLPDVELAPGGFSQISGILNNTQPPLVNGYVRIERVNGLAPYYAYEVINDNQNSDGSFVPPLAENALSGKSSMTVPVIVDNGSFGSELVLANWAGSSKKLTLEFVAGTISTPDGTAKLILTLKPGEQLIVPSFVQYLRDNGVAGIGAAGTSYVGALFISAEAGDLQGIAAGARTTAMGDIGRYGLFYTAVPLGASLTSSGWIYGLQQNLERPIQPGPCQYRRSRRPGRSIHDRNI